MNDLAVHCVNVSKTYRRYSRKRKFQTLKSALLGGELLADLKAADAIRALWPLDLHVRKGEALGIVGGNGSGKSTLMKLIYGTTKPTTGQVTTQGRVSALIELGAGFHPEISGRENVLINGIMLGLSRRQVMRKFDEIVEFAELHDFIDAPVKTYSSGMYARLGFAVAISVKPDVLLIDEVLAVGDEAFSHKCAERIRSLKAEGRTLVLVTHDLAMVEKLCDRAVWLRSGKLTDDGEPRRVIDAYRLDVAHQEEVRLGREHRQVEQELSREQGLAAPASPLEPPTEEEAPILPDAEPEPPPPPLQRWGSREAEIVSVALCGLSGEPKHVFDTGEPLEVRLKVVAKEPLDDFVFGVGIFRDDGVHVFGTNTQIERYRPGRLEGACEVCFRVEALDLTEGSYDVDVAVHREDGLPYDYHRRLYSFRVNADVKDAGIYRPRHAWTFVGGVKFRS